MFLMTTLSGRDLRGMAFWLMGDLATPPASRFAVVISGFDSCRRLDLYNRIDLNLILTGEQEARHLGVNVYRVKLVVYVASFRLTGLAVSVSGAIGYVGLLVPHVMRMIFDTGSRLLIPTSAIGGAIIIVAATCSPGQSSRRPSSCWRDDGYRWRSRIYLSDAAGGWVEPVVERRLGSRHPEHPDKNCG